MAHITMSIPDSLYVEMKKHSEIKWSEITRVSIAAYLKNMKGSTHASEILARLSPEARQAIERIPWEKAVALYEKMTEEEWKKLKSLTRVR